MRPRLSSGLPIILFKFLTLCKKLVLLYSNTLLHTRKTLPFSVKRQKKNSNCARSSSDVYQKQKWTFGRFALIKRITIDECIFIILGYNSLKSFSFAGSGRLDSRKNPLPHVSWCLHHLGCV